MRPVLVDGVDLQEIEHRQKANERLRQRARELFADEGMSYRAIARELRVAHSTVRSWIDPRVAEDERQRKRGWRQARTRSERPPSPFELITGGMMSNTAEDRYEGKVGPQRRKLPLERRSISHRVSVGGFSFYITAGMYRDGTVGEIFIKGAGREGSTVQGLLDGYATMWSIGVQYGAEVEMLARKFAHMRFEPFGDTDNPDIPWASSLLDYIARWLAWHFGSAELNADLRKIAEEMRNRR